MCVCVRACVRACVCACVRARASSCVCVCVRARVCERESIYNNFIEPDLSPKRLHKHDTPNNADKRSLHSNHKAKHIHR